MTTTIATTTGKNSATSADQNKSARLGFGIGESPVFNIDMQPITTKKEIYLLRANGQRESLDIVNETFSLPSLSRMESLAEIIQGQTNYKGIKTNQVTAQWLPSRNIALFQFPIMDFDISIRGRKDTHTARGMIKAGFTGACRRVWGAMFHRAVCANGMVLAGEFAIGSIKNTKNADARETQMEVRFDKVIEMIAKEKEQLQRLASIPKNDKEIKAFIKRMIIGENVKPEDVSTRSENQVNDIYRMTVSGIGNTGGTSYDILNGFTQYVTHNYGNDSTREESALVGSGFNLVSEVHEALVNA